MNDRKRKGCVFHKEYIALNSDFNIQFYTKLFKSKIWFYKFALFYFQVLSDYLNKNFDSIDHDTAIQLGCLEIRRLFKDMLQNALDKKSNIEYLEKEVGLHKFLPKVVLETVKSKSIRKLIQQHFKKFSNFTERDCMFKFMDLLKTVYRYDQERFRFVSYS